MNKTRFYQAVRGCFGNPGLIHTMSVKGSIMDFMNLSRKLDLVEYGVLRYYISNLKIQMEFRNGSVLTIERV